MFLSFLTLPCLFLACSLAIDPQTSDLFSRSHKFCQSLVAETWVEVLYIPRDGVSGLHETCNADLAIAEASWYSAILSVPTYAQVCEGVETPFALSPFMYGVAWLCAPSFAGAA
jgi:hypothetical protein